MDIEFFGANCIRLTTKKASVVVDDTLAAQGGKSITKNTDIAVHTQASLGAKSSPILTISNPGEYEVQGVSVTGVQARAHTDEPGIKTATIYKFVVDDTHIVVSGHIYPELDEHQLEAIGRVDVLLVPVGGHGFTLDPIGALKVIRQIEPSVVVPTQYNQSGLQFEVPALSLEEALQGLAMHPKDTDGVLDKLKTKEVEKNAQTSLVVVRTSR